MFIIPILFKGRLDGGWTVVHNDDIPEVEERVSDQVGEEREGSWLEFVDEALPASHRT